MQITTATRTVEIYANTEAGITYRNVKDGAAYGPVRTADRATAKAGSVGREILDALDAAAEVTETVATEVAPVATETVEITEGTEIEVAGRKGLVTAVWTAAESRSGRGWAGVTWFTAEDGSVRPSYGFAWLDQVTVVPAAQLTGRAGTAYAPGSKAAATIRRAVNLKW